MKPDEIRETVRSMWLTTPETELLGCIAVALAEILEAVRPDEKVAQARAASCSPSAPGGPAGIRTTKVVPTPGSERKVRVPWWRSWTRE